MLRALLISAMLVYGTFQAHSQKLIFENLSVNNGLPASEIYNLVQDHNGYIWVFTEYGIVKHNGATFVQVCKNISLKESEVYGVCEGPTGDLFFINSKLKVYCVRNDRAYKVNGLKGVTERCIADGSYAYSLHVDAKNTLRITGLDKWFEVKRDDYFIEGLPKAKFNSWFKDKPFPVKYDRKDKTIGKPVVNILNLFPNHLVYVRSNIFKPRETKINVHNGRLNLRKFGKQQILSVGQSILIREVNGKTRRKTLNQEIICMEVDSKGSIWAGLRSGGLLELNQNLEIVNHYFGSTIISDILFDDEDGMWVSTIGKGLYHCKNVHLRSYKEMTELMEGIAFIKIENNNLFVGTKEGSLSVKRNNRFTPIQFNFEPYTISDVCYSDNFYFISTHNGFWKINAKSFIPERVLKPDQPTPSYGIRPLGNGQLITINSRTVSTLNTKTGKLNLLTAIIRKVRFIAERKKGEFFTSTSNGIMQFHNTIGTYPKYLKELSRYRVTSIKTDSSDNVWFCTKENSIFRLNPKNELKRYTDLPNPIINDITFTSNNMVVLSTNKGAYACSREDFEKNRNWKLVLAGEVTQSTEHEKILLIGTKNGLNEVDIANISSKKTYHFFLNEVKANSFSVASGKKIELKPEQNNVTFNYTFLKYNSNRPNLNYKLKGPIELSGSVTGSNIQFQNLDPGEYQLTVYPELHFENQKGLIDERTLVVLPAFWETTWFTSCCVLAILAFIVWVIWMIIQRRNRKQQSEYQIERMLTEYRLTALKAQVNPHFMSNSLAAIQNLILQNETDNATLYIAKFSLLLRSLLEYSNKPAASLKNELEMIGLYVELEQLRFSHSFLFELDIDPNLDLNDTYIPALITQPFVENAIWHGLLPMDEQKNSRLILKISVENQSLIISIIDNGVGRTQKKDLQKGRESKGTDLIISRIETLNQLYQTTGGRVEILDLYDEDKPTGTRVNIVLPQHMLNQLHDNY